MPEKLDNERLRYVLSTWPEFAIEYLDRYYKPRLIRQAEWKIHDTAAAEDIAQDTIVHIWKNRVWIVAQVGLNIENYIARVTRNMAITYYKRSLFQADIRPEEILNEKLISVDPDPQQNEVERDRILWVIISKFPLREQQCMSMKFRQEMAVEEIAAALGITKKGVEANITRAYKRLRQYKDLLS